MVRSIQGFLRHFRKHYPGISLKKIYGTDEYIIDKQPDPVDAYCYKARDLGDGHWVLQFAETEEYEAQEQSKIGSFAPTTFCSFRTWLKRNDSFVKVISRKHYSHTTPSKLLHPDLMPNKNEALQKQWFEECNYYMYELQILDPIQYTTFSRLPWIGTGDSIICCVKAGNTTSKRVIYNKALRKTINIQNRLTTALLKYEFVPAERAEAENEIHSILFTLPVKYTIEELLGYMHNNTLIDWLFEAANNTDTDNNTEEERDESNNL